MSDPKKLEKAVFAAARKLEDPAAREVLLDEACDGDPVLRTRLERLLAVEAAADRLFEGGPSPALAAESLAAAAGLPPAASDGGLFPIDSPGSSIGRYRLLERLGAGGCGVVFRAEQLTPVHREVALKIIRHGMATASVTARFEAERQALAMMDHPAIARVFDAGTTPLGRPYFVMERVQGVRITTFCDTHRLDLAERLRLFVGICHAIQHAHQKGVLHRDIKPSNVLVSMQDGVPLPKVIDFGIAKATRPPSGPTTVPTPGEPLLGTPDYMSPEQAAGDGDIDTRSDVYSLGVLLHELLVGRTPFEPATAPDDGAKPLRPARVEDEAAALSKLASSLPPSDLARIAEARRIAPARLVAALRGDLDCIVAKALAQERRHRYETADGLAQDVDRFLVHEPIGARPSTRLYQAGKLMRRHRGAFAGAAAVLLALTIGLGSSTWLFFRERAARREAERGRMHERLLRRQAELRGYLAEAASLAGQNRFAEADELLASHPLPATTLEGSTVFRMLGDWAAAEGKWPRAAAYFDWLRQIDRLEPSSVTSLDQTRSAVTLALTGDDAGYDSFRHAAVRKFASTGDATAAERTIKNCLLRTPDAELLASLLPLAETAAQAFSVPDADAVAAPWGCVSLALLELRRGHPEAAIEWSRRSLTFGETPVVRVATAQTILAMALRQQGRNQEAGAALAASHRILDGRADFGTGVSERISGFWFDWGIARILLQEADTLAGGLAPGGRAAQAL